jgi:hypothetical protein
MERIHNATANLYRLMMHDAPVTQKAKVQTVIRNINALLNHAEKVLGKNYPDALKGMEQMSARLLGINEKINTVTDEESWQHVKNECLEPLAEVNHDQMEVEELLTHIKEKLKEKFKLEAEQNLTKEGKWHQKIKYRLMMRNTEKKINELIKIFS